MCGYVIMPMHIWVNGTKAIAVECFFAFYAHHCIDPYYYIILCAHILQRVGGPGKARALLHPRPSAALPPVLAVGEGPRRAQS